MIACSGSVHFQQHQGSNALNTRTRPTCNINSNQPATCSNNNKSTYSQFAALSDLLIWRRPLSRVPRYKVTGTRSSSTSRYPHIPIPIQHIQGGWRTCGKLLCNYEIFLLRFLCVVAAGGQRRGVMLNKSGADLIR